MYKANISLTDEELIVDLEDGRSVTVPLDWYPRLLHGAAAERSNWQLLGDVMPSNGLTLMSTSGSKPCWQGDAAERVRGRLNVGVQRALFNKDWNHGRL